jgi:UBX domain
VVFGRKGQEAVLSVLGRQFGISEGPGGGGGTTLAGMGVGGNVLVRLGFRVAPTSASLTPAPSASSSASNSVPVSLPPSDPSRISSPTQQPLQPPTLAVQQQQAPTPQSEPAPSSPPAPPNVYLQTSSSSSQSAPPPTPSPPTESPAPPRPIVGPGNRQRVVYSAASGSTPIAAKRNSPSKIPSNRVVEHDESAYNMTTEQAKGYQAYLSAATKSQSEKILMTREMREAAERERAAKRAFQECHVRIRFPDASQVQGTFNPDETVADIYAFVKDQISSPHPFQLRTSFKTACFEIRGLIARFVAEWVVGG